MHRTPLPKHEPEPEKDDQGPLVLAVSLLGSALILGAYTLVARLPALFGR